MAVLGNADAAKLSAQLGVTLGQPSPYGLALRRAVSARERGTVALLVAVGMQSPAWSGVAGGRFLSDGERAPRGRHGWRGAHDFSRGDGALVTRAAPSGDDKALIARFLEMMAAEAGAANNTLSAYRRDLEGASETLGGRLGAADPPMLARLGEDWLSLARSSVARKASALRRFFGFLAEEGAARGRSVRCVAASGRGTDAAANTRP